MVVGAGHEGKYKIIPSEMPELIRGCELTSYQTSGTLHCHEDLLNERDGWKREVGEEGAEAFLGQRGNKAEM